MEFLSLRNGVWQYQRRVPQDVVELLGTRWRQSLKTQDEPTARVAARELATTHDGLIAAARARLAAGPVNAALADLEEAGRAAEQERGALRDRRRVRRRLLERAPELAGEPEALDDAVSAVIDGRLRKVERTVEAALRKVNVAIAREAKKALAGAARATRDKVAASNGVDGLMAEISAARTEAGFLNAAASMLAVETDEIETEAETEAREDDVAILFSRAKRVERSKAEKEALVQSLVPGVADAGLYIGSGPTLTQLFQRWCREAAIKPDRQRKVAVYVRRFTDLFGDLPAARITKAQVRDFAAALATMPDITHLKLADRKKDVRTLIEIGRAKPSLPRLGQGTINRHLEAIAAILAWCEDQDIISSNPAHRVKAPAFAAPEKDIRPFTPAELRDLLKVVDAEWGGADRANRDRWWIVRIAIWSGARLAEICQLTKADVRQERGIWLFDLNDHGGKSIKNRASVRRLPIHPQLIEKGFLEHVSASMEDRVFPSLPIQHPGVRGHGVSKSFGDLKRSKLKLVDTRVTFHSLRHSFADACREAGVPHEVREALMGHAIGRYGDGYSLATLSEHINRIDPLDQKAASVQAAA